MNSEQRRTICLHRIQSAYETLQEARILFEQNMFRGTANRIYYALFYSVSALALAHGFRSSKHTGLQSWFNKEMMKTGIIERDLGKIYNSAFDIRSESDYTDLIELDANEINKMLQRSESFIERIRQLTLRKLNEVNDS